MERARCAQLGWDFEALDHAFFSEPNSEARKESGRAALQGWFNLTLARRTCAKCPVRAECLSYALALEDVALPSLICKEDGKLWYGLARSDVRGVWGGTTEQERAATAHLPRAERLETLDAVFHEQIRGLLAPDERVA